MRISCGSRVYLSAVVGVFGVLRGAEGAVPAYTPAGSFQLPTGAATFDVLADGRVVAMLGGEIHFQSSVNSGVFSKGGSVASSLVNPFGASFVKVSPGGTRLAIGDGNFGPSASVLFVDIAGLNPGADSAAAGVMVPNYDAAWGDDSTLLVSGAVFGSGSYVNRVDGVTLTSATVLTGVGDGSGGVGVRGGRVFVGAGFDLDPGIGTETGDIRAFDLGELLGAGSALDFSSSGVRAARALSGAFLSFDGAGTLFVGGGDFAGESGFAAALDPDAVAAALAGGPAATSATGLMIAPAGKQFYSTVFNGATGEVLVRAFGDDTVYRYAVPAPSVGMMVLFSGLFAHRRRRG